MNRKTLTISDCQDCPWFGHECPWWDAKCKKLDRKIEQDSDTGTYPIPDDCPLDDAETDSADKSATPDDWTDSCTEHIGALLWDHKTYSVRLIDARSVTV